MQKNTPIKYFLSTLLLFTMPLSAATRVDRPLVLEGVHLVDLEQGRVHEDRTVVVSGNRITTVSSHDVPEAPTGSTVIDARGLYLLPGLHDMHVHVETSAVATALGLPVEDGGIDHESALFAYLANGITTVQVCSGARDLLALRDSIARGDTLGPRLIVGSPMLAGEPPILPPPLTRIALTAEDGERAARELAASGYDFLKLRENLPLAAFVGLAREAEKLGLRMAGHVPRGEGLSLERVLGVGGYGVLHLQDLVGPGAQSREQMQAIASLVEEHGGEVVTTLTVMANLIDKLRDYDATLTQPEMRYMHPLLKNLWRNNPFHEPATPEGIETMELWLANQQRLLVSLIEAGVVVMAGTDALNPTIVPGFSIHEELALMEEAGLTRVQVLRAATVVPARFLAAEAEAGGVQPGQPANLLLLRSNPLANLGALREPAGVVVAGRWLAKDTIERRLEQVAKAFVQTAPAPAADAAEAEKAPSLEERLDTLLAANYPDGEPGAAVLVKNRGTVVLRRGYGQANVEHRVSIRPETVFRLASVTKPLTARAVLVSIERGALGLTTRVGDVLADYPPPGSAITVAQLLRHESGLPQIVDLMIAHSMEDLTPGELVALFRQRPLVASPGEGRLYSNANYIVLGAMLEATTGLSYGDAMRALVLEPLGMTRTKLAKPGEIVLGRAAGYTTSRQGVLRNAPYFSPVLSSSAGALLSTVDDLARFDEMLAQDAKAEEEATGAVPRHAWGWQPSSVGTHTAYEHGGSSPGWVAAVLRVPARHLFVAILSNRGYDREPLDLAHRLAEEVLAEASRKNAQLSVESHRRPPQLASRSPAHEAGCCDLSQRRSRFSSPSRACYSWASSWQGALG